MMKKSIFQSFGVALAFALCAMATPANAGSVDVYADTGAGTGVAVGTTTGATVAAMNGTILTTINGSAVPVYTLGIAENLTSTTSGTGTKVISYEGATVQLEMKIESVTYSSTELVSVGKITSVTGGMPGGYNFATLIGGTTTLTESGDFTTIFGHSGSFSVGTLGVVEAAAVPEPGTMALLGIGMTGLLAFRRLFKRVKTA